MVDEGRVARLLRAVGERTRRLRDAAARSSDERDELWSDGVKYLLVTAIEGCVDVAQHVAASERFPAPESNADAVRLLGARGVIDEDLAVSLARAVGFRDVLVHQYVEIDESVVLGALERVDEFDRFVAEVSRWISAHR